jgi:hypothetical protein
MSLDMKDVVTLIVDFAYSDSHVVLDVEAVADAYGEDLKNNGGEKLTEAACALLIMGGDDGAVPARLKALYPKLDALIASEFE